jgi:hypothetical protein
MSRLVIVSCRSSRDYPAHTMTVGELIEMLQEYDPEAPIAVRGYDGYLYNGIGWDTIEDEEEVDA